MSTYTHSELHYRGGTLSLRLGEFTVFIVRRSKHTLYPLLAITMILINVPNQAMRAFNFWNTQKDCVYMLRLLEIGDTVKTRISSLNSWCTKLSIALLLKKKPFKKIIFILFEVFFLINQLSLQKYIFRKIDYLHFVHGPCILCLLLMITT